MTVDKNDIQKLSQLARINLSEDNVDATTDRINSVLNMIDALQQIDTTNISPMSHPLDAVQRLREDIVTEANEHEQMLSNAPDKQDGLFLVPRVIE